MNLNNKAIDFLLLFITLAIGLISFITNLGWLRVFLMIGFVIYYICFIVIGIIYINKGCSTEDKSGKRKYFIMLATFLIFNLACPDVSDSGDSYNFFGFLRYAEGKITDILMFAGQLLFAISAITIGIARITYKKKSQ